MKKTIFNVINLFDENATDIQNQLLQLSSSIRDLEPIGTKSILNMSDTSLSHMDDIDNMLIYRALIKKGYLLDSPFSIEKLTKMLNILRYQNINIVKFGIVENTSAVNKRLDLIIVLQDDRELIYSNNVKTLEYILSNSGTMTDKIIKDTEFNEKDYKNICLFDYDYITHTLTHIETEIDRTIEEEFIDYKPKSDEEKKPIKYVSDYMDGSDDPELPQDKYNRSIDVDINHPSYVKPIFTDSNYNLTNVPSIKDILRKPSIMFTK